MDRAKVKSSSSCSICQLQWVWMRGARWRIPQLHLKSKWATLHCVDKTLTFMEPIGLPNNPNGAWIALANKTLHLKMCAPFVKVLSLFFHSSTASYFLHLSSYHIRHYAGRGKIQRMLNVDEMGSCRRGGGGYLSLFLLVFDLFTTFCVNWYGDSLFTELIQMKTISSKMYTIKHTHTHRKTVSGGIIIEYQQRKQQYLWAFNFKWFILRLVLPFYSPPPAFFSLVLIHSLLFHSDWKAMFFFLSSFPCSSRLK